MAGGLGGTMLDDGWILRHDCVILTFALRLLRLLLSVVLIVQDDLLHDGARILRHHRLVVKVAHLLIVEDGPHQDGAGILSLVCLAIKIEHLLMVQDGAEILHHHSFILCIAHLLIVQDDPPQDGVPVIPKGLNQRQTGSSSCWCFKKSGV